VPARLLEVELRVRDLERALRFYRDLVGLPFGAVETHEGENVPHAHAAWGEWGARGELLMVNLYPAAGGADPTQASVGFVVDDLEQTHARLVSAGATVTRPPERRPWGVSATYRDPDGNTVSLTERPREKG
jgi:predicted enzyme related to lactoylglutathione lyase